MNEGLQILLFDILFQRLHDKNTKFCTKNQVLSFWWLALKTTFLAKNSYESKVKY